MSKGVNLAFVLLLGFILKECYGDCNKTYIKNIDVCTYSVECQGTIRDVDMAFKCDHPGRTESVHLVLKNASERLDKPLKPTHFLNSVTDLKTIGVFNATAVSIFQHTPVLRNLCMFNNAIYRMPHGSFYRLENLTKLDLSYNLLMDIEGLFEFKNKRSKLRSLILSNNEILFLTRHTFEQLYSLVELDLSRNLIRELFDKPFRNLNQLDILNLDYNEIEELGDSLNHLTNLRHLFLKGNLIAVIDDKLTNVVQHLQTFDLSYNDIDNALPTILIRDNIILSSNGICRVILSNNYIQYLPNATEVWQFTHTKRRLLGPSAITSIVLDLSHNDIDEIEYNAFEGTNKIVSLDVSYNQLYDFFVRPQDLANVVSLNLSNNYLNRLLYETFMSMEYLEILDVSHNIIDVIEKDAFASSPRLKYVNMKYNEIKTLDGLEIQMFHPLGGTLILSNNHISKMSLGVGNGVAQRSAQRLRVLSLNSNNISDIGEIKLHLLMDLWKLDLSNNSIQVLSEDCPSLPSGLVFLDLSQNKIYDIRPSAFSCLSQLHVLRLSQNKLEKLSIGVFNGMKSLLYLDLSNNKIKFLDSAPFNDLKSLKVLSVRYNGIERITEGQWIGHNQTFSVYLDGNYLTCEWLNKSIDNFKKGWSNMKPVALNNDTSGVNFVENIPCIPEEQKLENQSLQTVLADERLLSINKLILKEIVNQNEYMKNLVDEIKQQKN